MVDLSQIPPSDLASEQDSTRGVAIPSKRNPPASETTPPCGCLCGGCSCPSCFSHGTSVDGFFSTRLLALNASSFEAPQPKQIPAVPPSLDILRKLNEHSATQLAKTRTEQFVEDINDAPWQHFLSDPNMTSDAPDMSGMIFGPMDLEGSMENNPDPSGSQSMMRSYKSALSVRSDAASAIIQRAGEALTAIRPATSDNPFLRLL